MAIRYKNGSHVHQPDSALWDNGQNMVNITDEDYIALESMGFKVSIFDRMWWNNTPPEEPDINIVVVHDEELMKAIRVYFKDNEDYKNPYAGMTLPEFIEATLGKKIE